MSSNFPKEITDDAYQCVMHISVRGDICSDFYSNLKNIENKDKKRCCGILFV